MADASESLNEALARLREDFRRRLPERFAEIEAQATRLRTAPADTEALKTLHRLLHTLAGSGGTFGFTALRDAAHALEMYLVPLLESGLPPNDTQRVQIEALLAAVRLAGDAPANAREITTAPAVQPSDGKWVYLLDEDVDSAQPLAAQLGHFGYAARVFPRAAELIEALRHAPPVALILHLALHNEALAATFRAAGLDAVPKLFLCTRDDIHARLRAVRAGGSAYFVKPLDVLQVVDALDRLTDGRPPEPYRILLVDDSAEAAAYHALALQRAGMATHAETDPLRALEATFEFRPDLVLMDMYMPGASGLELAAVIRQKEDFTGLPVVFLSGETDANRQQTTMTTGGDDFLTKPVDPERLVAAVAQRAKRFRQLRARMVRDGLTGLLNHAETIERLKFEMAHAARRQAPLAFCLIDLDHFKTVNDTYGHLAGDQVIKGLARQLRQCLRQTDLVGRYGGEEFSVVMPDTDVTTAAEVLDQLRANFAKIGQRFGDEERVITFSGGVATCPPHNDPVKLIGAADKALYEAKRAGRNRVCQAEN